MTSAIAIRFFKIILKESVEDGTLKIPNKFIRKYGGVLSNPMFLKPPDGTEWKVYWTKLDGEIWLQDCWQEFTRYYSLDHGHLVLFEYKGTSDFEVHIFDMSSLEIEYPKNGNHDEMDNLDHITDDSVEILDKLPKCQKMTRLKSPVSSPRPHKKLKSATTGDAEKGFNLQHWPQNVQTKGSKSQETNSYKSTVASVKQELNEDVHRRILTTERPKVEQLSSTKISEALHRATTFKPKNPSFELVMKPHYANGYSLNMPLQFVEKYLKKRKGNVLLWVLDGRTWPASYSVPKITAGWKKFASDNNLKVGDVCVFELIKSRGLLFKIFIFRAEEEPSCRASQELVQGDGGVNCLDSERILDVESKTVFTSEGGEATERTSLLIRPCHGTSRALKEANRFASENPFFMINIRQIYLRKASPNVPIVFIRKYLEMKQNVMIQFGKKLWPIKVIHYPLKCSAMFSAGWRRFAKEIKLQAGVVCIFELINREDAVLDVHIFRGHS